MKEIKNIIDAYHQIDFSQHKVALATVVRVEGSSYRRAGARMLISDSGEWVGGISGGCLEGDALKRARFAIAQNKASVVTYDTSEDDPYQIGVGLGCNGIIDVLLTPLDVENTNNQVLALQQCVESRKPEVLVTVTKLRMETDAIQLGDTFRYESASQFERIFPLKEISEELLSDIQDGLISTKSSIKNYALEDGTIQLFIEVLIPATHLLVYGGNYDIYPMVKLAKEIGWKVSVICNPLKVQKQLFTWADAVIEKENAKNIAIDPYTVAILMAHDYNTDFTNLRYLLSTDIPYIGMLGPKKRSDKMFKAMTEEGETVSEKDAARIASPVGLDIGANTPEEIAISILAEIKTIFSKRSGERLKFRDRPIYEV